MTRGTGTHKRWGGTERRKEPRPINAQTIIPRRALCDCEPGSCKYPARECRDWIKRAAPPKQTKGTA